MATKVTEGFAEIFERMTRVDLNASDVKPLIMQARKSYADLEHKQKEAMEKAEAAKIRYEEAVEISAITDKRVRKLENALQVVNQIHRSLTGVGVNEHTEDEHGDKQERA